MTRANSCSPQSLRMVGKKIETGVLKVRPILLSFLGETLLNCLYMIAASFEKSIGSYYLRGNLPTDRGMKRRNGMLVPT